MQRVDGQFVFSASDLNNFLECRRLSDLEELVALGELVRPADDDEAAALLRRKGEEHEAAYLAELRVNHEVVSFARSAPGLEAYRAAEAATLEAMRSGAEIIYQATFFDGTFLGHADFLHRVARPSNLGDWSYEVSDTKLALASKPYFLVQLCNYSEHLERLTGVAPKFGHIILGNKAIRSFDLSQFSAYYRHLKAAFLARIEEHRAANIAPEYPQKRSHCKVCPWNAPCRDQRKADDHLSLVAWMRRDQITKLESAQIRTVAELAAASDDARPFSMAAESFSKLRRQAAMQVRGLTEGPLYQIIPHDERMGLGILPKPNDGDVFFDMEGDPHYEPGRGLEYLFGAWTLDKEQSFRAFWALDRAEEKRALEAFVDFIVARRKQYPDLHVYHYASYEKTALRKLAQAHATREREVDDLLRGEVLVDLFAVVRQSLVISEDSYSIKRLEKFYGLDRKTAVKKGDDSILMFERYRASGDRNILVDIEDYNRDDCYSTLLLRDWLLARREEAHFVLGRPVPFRETKVLKPLQNPADEERRTALEVEVLNALPLVGGEAAFERLNDDERTRYLLGNALAYHRREDKPVWWAFFDRCDNADDLFEFDREAIARIAFAGDIPPYQEKKSTVYTYRFPEQRYKMGVGDTVHDPLSRERIGTIVALDHDALTVAIKTTADEEIARALTALIPGGPFPTTSQQKAVVRVAEAYLDGSLRKRYPATADLITRTSRFAHNLFLSETVQKLDGSYLFVQGPPGTGKTTLSAQVIADLLVSGKRVGIVSTGHKAVHNILHKIEAEMLARGKRFTGRYKHSETSSHSKFASRLEEPMIASLDDNKAFEGRDFDLAGGTPFLFTREFAQPFDYIFIEEAGQVALADAIGISSNARNVVLIGDPAQLAQVSQGSHPYRLDRSVLEHVLGDERTIPPDRGVFLERSYRMHPMICEFISTMMYDGRLHAADSTRNNRVESAGLSGSGLRYISVEHSGNSAQSSEEADVIVTEVATLLEGSVKASEIIVVTPYNAQRLLIERRLRAAGIDVAVGTVDKFQGQEADVVFYSMATSSGDDVPRDLNFLFEQNRLNVAVSRARAMTVLVCSPRLLDVSCNTPEQMALVNFLCAYVENSTLPARPGVSAAANASAALSSG